MMVLNGTVKVGGLGGTPYRSGSYEYYIGEKTEAKDAKGIGAFLLAGSEMEQARDTRRLGGTGQDGAAGCVVQLADAEECGGADGAVSLQVGRRCE